MDIQKTSATSMLLYIYAESITLGTFSKTQRYSIFRGLNRFELTLFWVRKMINVIMTKKRYMSS